MSRLVAIHVQEVDGERGVAEQGGQRELSHGGREGEERPETRPSEMEGTITCRNVRVGLAPRLAAASLSIRTSTARSALSMARNTNGSVRTK